MLPRPHDLFDLHQVAEIKMWVLWPPKKRGPGGGGPWVHKHTSNWLCFERQLHVLLGFRWWFSRQRIGLQCRRHGFDPWIWKIPWRREWQPTPVFLQGKSHGQRNLVVYSPWGRKESDTTITTCYVRSVACFTCNVYPIRSVLSICTIRRTIICEIACLAKSAHCKPSQTSRL